MAKKKNLNRPAIIQHGWNVLPAVWVDAYNEELRDKDGYLGDRANKGAFRDILDRWRLSLASNGNDPFGNTPTHALSRADLDNYLKSCDPTAAGLVHTAVEEFAQELATVSQRFLQLDEWRGTEHIVVGGGLSGSHIGRLAIGRCMVVLTERGLKTQMSPIENDPDEAGLLGGLQLAPSWILEGHDAIVAVDIGGTNLRVGVVQMKMKKGDITKSGAWKSERWRHKDDNPTRDGAVERIASMIGKLVEDAHEAELRVAPFIAIACPGLITRDGTIEQGGQNLPGNWQDRDFNLSAELARQLPRIRGHEPLFVIHNDAVVQGLSEIPNMTKVDRWGVFTIGTGLGNARFTNR